MTCEGFSCADSVVEDIRQGKIVILFDSERENEGDFVMAATKVNAQAIKFMLRYGSGIVSLALTADKAKDLGLPMLRAQNNLTSPSFAPSIDASFGIGSGVSAHDRAASIAAAVANNSTRESIKVPGHIFPLIAAAGGVLERPGHTESSVELVLRAGLTPAAVICEVMNSEFEVATLSEIMAISQKYGIKVGLIKDVVATCVSCHS